MEVQVGGAVGFLVLIADVWAIINVIQSRSGIGVKVLWTVLILMLPFFGWLLWLIAGPRASQI